MKRAIRILETPLYLLTIALACFEMNLFVTSVFLVLVSVVRLYINHITDEFNYKNS
jgi:hypothetical protein